MAYVFASVIGFDLSICRKINGYVAWSKWKENWNKVNHEYQEFVDEAHYNIKRALKEATSLEYRAKELKKLKKYGTIDFGCSSLEFTLYLRMSCVHCYQNSNGEGAYVHISETYRNFIWKALYCMGKSIFNSKWVAELKQQGEIKPYCFKKIIRSLGEDVSDLCIHSFDEVYESGYVKLLCIMYAHPNSNASYWDKIQ
jgi:hypothetical protein